MGRVKMPPKPRLPFCWWCSRKLYGTIHATANVDGAPRILHKTCLAEIGREYPGSLLIPTAAELRESPLGGGS